MTFAIFEVIGILFEFKETASDISGNKQDRRSCQLERSPVVLIKDNLL